MTGRLLMILVGGAALVMLGACGADDDDRQAGWGEHPIEMELPYASHVVSFEPGEGAGFGGDEMPGVVLGPPDGRGVLSGSQEVVSLGDGGEIVVGFGDREIVDGEGADFVVFENPFWPQGDHEQVYAELGEVSVSEDGETWHTFECTYGVDDDPPYPGCAGWTPTLEYDAEEVVPLDPSLTGGDAFDLADVGLERARYVRIRDLWGIGVEPMVGFDLDAVGLVNFQ